MFLPDDNRHSSYGNKIFHISAICIVALFFSGFQIQSAYASNQPILFVSDMDYPPISYLENGTPKGVCIDIVKALSKITGREISIKLMEWDKAQTGVQNGDADLLGPLAVSDERKAMYDFTDTVMTLEYSLFVRDDHPQFLTIKDLKGKAVGVTTGGFPRQALKAERDVNLVLVTDYKDGLNQLQKGTIEAFAGDKWVTLYYLQQYDMKDIKMLDQPLAVSEAAFAVRKGNLQLRDELDRGLAQLRTQGLLKEIFEKWSGKQIVFMTKEKLRKTIVIVLSSIVLILLTLLSLWIYTLKRQIVERKQAEETLRKSEQEYRRIVETANEGIWMTDENSRTTYVNARMAEILGYEVDEMIGREFSFFLFEEELSDHANRMENRRQGLAEHYERKFRGKDGKAVWTIVSATAVKDNRENFCGSFGMLTDITGRKRIEALRDGQNRVLKLLATGASLPHVLETLVRTIEGQIDGLIGSVLLLDNDGMRLRLGAAPSLSDTYNQAIDGGRIGPAAGSCGTAAYKKRRVIVEDIRTDPLWTDYRELAETHNLRAAWSQPILTHAGEVLGTFAMYYREPRRPTEAELSLIDSAAGLAAVAIESRRVEDESRKSRQFLSDLIENSGALIFTKNRNGVYEMVNRKWEEIVGLDRRATIGKTDLELFPGTVGEMFRENDLEVMETGKTLEKEEFLEDGIGRRYFLAIKFPLRDDTGTISGICGMATEITERKRAEDALRELNINLEGRVAERTAELAVARDRAEAADRLKSAFLASMSHELRTPLNSIIGFTGIILQGFPGPLNAEQTKQLGIVQHSARHLLSLINDVLDISKIEAGQLEVTHEPFHMSEAIEKAVQSITPLAEKKGLALVVNVAPDIGQLAGDKRRVEQILINLLGNAVKFTERGEVRVDCKVGAGRVEISVRDTGIGIEPGDMGKLFEAFRQIETGLARRYEGTGLGLSLCRKLVGLLGGEIWGSSDGAGKGSAFTFVLPMQIGGENEGQDSGHRR